MLNTLQPRMPENDPEWRIETPFFPDEKCACGLPNPHTGKCRPRPAFGCDQKNLSVSHDTVNGWCCACDADITKFNSGRRMYEQGKADALKNIGQLRQLLNEDCITDPKKMVTNADLLFMLGQITEEEMKERNEKENMMMDKVGKGIK